MIKLLQQAWHSRVLRHSQFSIAYYRAPGNNTAMTGIRVICNCGREWGHGDVL